MLFQALISVQVEQSIVHHDKHIYNCELLHGMLAPQIILM